MSTRSNRLRKHGIAYAALALAIAGALVSADAAASGFQLREDSVAAMGRAYAGSTTAGDDASVVANNPAAMSDLSGTLLQADVTAIDISTHFHGSGTDAIGQPLSGDNGGNGGDVTPVPAIFFVTPLGDAWHLGLGVYAPFGLKTDYDQTWVGRYQAIHSKVQSMDLNVSLSWAVNPNVSLGASLIAQRTSANLTNAIDFGALIGGLQAAQGQAPTFLPQSADGYGKVEGSDWSYGWQVGAEFKLSPQDKLGLSYRGKINHTLSGSATFQVPPAAQFAFASAGLPVFQNTAASAPFATPASADVSYWHQTGGPISFGADLAWTGWSSFKTLQVNYANPAQPPTIQQENWRDTVTFAVGMDYKLNDQWTLRGGLGYDQTPTRDSTRDPRIPDGSRTVLSLGAGYSPSQNVRFDLGYMHLFVDDGHVNDVSQTGDQLVGYFSSHADLFGVSGQFKF